MKDFLKYTLASALGFILANVVLGILSVIVVLISIGSIMSAADDFKSKDKVSVEDNSILKVELDYPMAERAEKEKPFQRVMRKLNDQKQRVAYRNVLKSIRKASGDEKIEGILIETTGVPNSFAKLEEVRESLSNFKDSGKFVYSYSNILTQKGLYISSVADSVFLQREGLISFNGLVSQTTFFKGLLDKLGIKPYAFKIGRFKSAPEFLTRESLSESAKKQTRAILNNQQDQFLSAISASRGITMEKLKQHIDELEIRTAEDAVEKDLADDNLYQDQVNQLLRDRINLDASKDLETITLGKYQKTLDDGNNDNDNKVAIVYASGAIGLGEGEDNSIGAASMSDALEKVREDSTIKSVVLRVNSPGGGAMASDIIWREVKLTAQKKPLIVSMGDIAASGGYYISAPADTILAQRNTITGSIGIFALLVDWKAFWNDELGITFDRVKTGEYADFGNPNRPLTQKEKTVFKQYIEESYQDFIGRVAKGRDMNTSAVDSVARGRVWTGEAAKQANLVDQIGSFDEAIDLAAKKADVEDYQLAKYPEREDPFEELLGGFFQNYINTLLMGPVKQQIHQHERLKFLYEQGNGAYMMMPYNINVQ
jgi:protease-4